MISPGSKSGVNWIRLNSSPSTVAKELAPPAFCQDPENPRAGRARLPAWRPSSLEHGVCLQRSTSAITCRLSDETWKFLSQFTPMKNIDHQALKASKNTKHCSPRRATGIDRSLPVLRENQPPRQPSGDQAEYAAESQSGLPYSENPQRTCADPTQVLLHLPRSAQSFPSSGAKTERGRPLSRWSNI